MIGAVAHKRASVSTARQSMVLLKNDADRGLPFQPGKHLVVIGNDAANIVATMGNYNGNNICPHSSTDGSGLGQHPVNGGINTDCLQSYWDALNKTNALAGGTSALLTVGGAKGTVTSWDNASIAAAVALAKTADNLLVVVSNAEDEVCLAMSAHCPLLRQIASYCCSPMYQGGEGSDRKTIALRDDQVAMAAAVLAAASPAAHVALVLINGAVIAIEDTLRDAAPSILETFMPGVYGAEAVAETVWGSNVPGGKLPVTMYYANYTDECDIDDMSMQACGGRTYRYGSDYFAFNRLPAHPAHPAHPPAALHAPKPLPPQYHHRCWCRITQKQLCYHRFCRRG